MGNVRSWDALASAEQGAPISPLRAVATFLLVFQVCLRILWRDVMPRCHNCEIEYMPRTPSEKKLWHFFPERRDRGDPEKIMRYRISGARQATLGTRPRNGPAISPQPGARAVRLASPDSHYWGRQRRAGDAAQWSVVSGRPEIKPSRSCNSELTAEAISI